MDQYYLTSPMSKGEHNFAIIDRIKYPDIDESWPVVELVSPMLEPQASLYPWLLSLHEMDVVDWKAFMETLDQSEASSTSCLLLYSDQPMQDVRNQLINALYFKDETHQGHILRYYDPRVFFHLCWMLTPYLLMRTFPSQVVSHWSFYLDGNWHTVNFDKIANPLATGSLVTSSLATSPSLTDSRAFPMQQLQRCGLINQVLMKLPISADLKQREWLSRKIDTLVAQAEQLGLPTEEDKIAFAFHGLKLRDEFWIASRMSTFLQQAQNAPNYFDDETRSWDDAHWQMMTER